MRQVQGRTRKLALYLYRKSKGEARKALRAALKNRDEGIVPPSKMTVGIYLDKRLEDMRSTVSHRTWVTREGFVRNHIRPSIGTKKLSTLTADDASRLYKRKLAEGLTTSSVKLIHELLKQGLREAVRLNYISHNPLDDVKPPKQHTREMEVLTPQQVRRLLGTVRGQRWEGVFVPGAACGLRIGEALSLRYEDMDLAEGTISICRTLWKYNVYPPRPQAADAPSSFPR